LCGISPACGNFVLYARASAPTLSPRCCRVRGVFGLSQQIAALQPDYPAKQDMASVVRRGDQ